MSFAVVSIETGCAGLSVCHAPALPTALIEPWRRMLYLHFERATIAA
ncbi:hypothetical protein [Jiella endophytica]|nr:hypothetical protein [Jiella endophytica]